MTDHSRPPRLQRPALDETYFERARRRRAEYDQSASAPLRQLLCGALLAVALFAFWESFALSVATQRNLAVRILARAVPALTEVDLLLALHGQETQQKAQSSPNGVVGLQNFPVQVSLPATEVRGQTPGAIRALFVQTAAEDIYERGTRAFFRPDAAGTNATGTLFSTRWIVHEAFNLLNTRQHQRAIVFSLGLALLAAALAIIFALQIDAPGRLVGLAAIMLGSAIAAGILTAVVWTVVRSYASGANNSLMVAGWTMIADAIRTMALVNGVSVLTSIGLLIVGKSLVILARTSEPPKSSAELVGPQPRIERRPSRYE